MYKLVLTLHILSVVVGIGSVTLNGLYAAKAKQIGGPGQGAVMRVNFDVSMFAEKIIYTIPIWGILLIFIDHDRHHYSFGQTWIWLSIVLYVIGLGISHGVMVAGGKRMMALGQKLASGQGTPQDGAEAAAIEKRLAAGGMTLNLLLVVLVALMVAKPGL